MTDVKQLEEDIDWVEAIFQHLAENSYEYEDSHHARVIAAARAHLEAIKQEPYGYISTETREHLKRGQHYDHIHNECSGRYWIPVYTAPVRQEKPVVKVPKSILHSFPTGIYKEGYNECLEVIRAQNPHITFEVQK